MSAARTQKKKQKHFESMASRLPSFHEGGTLHVHPGGVLEGEPQPFDVPLPSSVGVTGQLPSELDPFTNTLIQEDFLPIPGQPGRFFDPVTGRIVDFTTGGGGAAGDPFAAGKFELDQLMTEAQVLNMQHQQAIASGNLQLAQQIEQRQAANAQRTFELQQQQLAATTRGQDVTLRGQDITAAGTGANVLGQLGTNLGNLQARRAENLAQLLANPRDFQQAQLFLGGGTPFLEQLAAGQNVPGQSVLRGRNIPTLGPMFAQGLQQILQRPELPFFTQAGEAAQQLTQPQAPVPQPGLESFFNPIQQQTFEQFRAAAPDVPVDIAAGIAQQPGEFRTFVERLTGTQPMKHGGQMVTDEPIVGIGMRSGQPKFTLGEPTAAHPQGAPELMEVKPLQGGGTVATKPRTVGGLRGTDATSRAVTTQQPVTEIPGQIPGSLDLLSRLNLDVARARATRGGESAGQIQATPSSGALAEQRIRAGQPTGAPRAPGIPFGPGFQLPPGAQQAPALTASEQLFQMQRGLNPRSLFNLLPSQQDLLAGQVSALGADPRDFFQSVLNQFPQGIDPSRIFRAGF